MKKFPKEYLEIIKNYLDKDYDKFFRAINSESQKAFQINTKLISIEDFKKEFAYKISKVPYTENCFYLEENEKLGRSFWHEQGMIYMQEPSSMIVAESVEINSNDVILDLCASPGGKSAHILNKLDENGLLVSNEIDSSRVKILKENMIRLKHKNIIITNSPPKSFINNEEVFDKIFVDAPCSGEGMMRKDDFAINQWSHALIEKCSTRQLDILESIKNCVKKDGYIIYSTCTFNEEENEKVIERFLKNNLDFINIEVKDSILGYTEKSRYSSVPFARRFYPHTYRGEGQFVAVLKRLSGGIKHKERKTTTNNNYRKIVDEFLLTNTNIKNANYNVFNNSVFILPNKNIDLKDVFIISNGVKLGDIEKDRIVPSHQFFVCYSNSFIHRYELNNDEYNQYSKGLEISTQLDKGFVALFYKNTCVGGGKISNNKIKNYLPKYLRK